MLLVHAEAVPTDITDSLELAGFAWKAVGSVDAVDRLSPEGGWAAVLLLSSSLESSLDFGRLMRRRETSVGPILLAMQPEWLAQLDVVEDLFDDFVLLPLRPGELEARLAHLLSRAGASIRPNVVEHGALALNLATYQAAVAGRPLDLTYMEYELLKHFATNPGRVLTREELLRQVWGYEYYGGARTVDVHVRRLRAKLGEQHAELIQTVRSVGYIFGRARWSD